MPSVAALPILSAFSPAPLMHANCLPQVSMIWVTILQTWVLILAHFTVNTIPRELPFPVSISVSFLCQYSCNLNLCLPLPSLMPHYYLFESSLIALSSNSLCFYFFWRCSNPHRAVSQQTHSSGFLCKILFSSNITVSARPTPTTSFHIQCCGEPDSVIFNILPPHFVLPKSYS